jgi:hypothetical protein
MAGTTAVTADGMTVMAAGAVDLGWAMNQDVSLAILASAMNLRVVVSPVVDGAAVV